MISLIVTIAIIGLIVWAVVTLIPMPQQFKTVILVIALICVLLLVLRAFGLLDGVHDVSVPTVR